MAAERNAETVEIDAEMRAVFRRGRPLNGSLNDYWAAPGVGSKLHAEWDDKPHRLLYDLIAFVIYQQDAHDAKLAKMGEALAPFADAADSYDPDEGDGRTVAWAHDFTLASLRRAREALSETLTGHHVPDCGIDREGKMVVVERDAEGKPSVWCDPCIASLVEALNKAGIKTIASCCGHDNRPGRIVLADGRELGVYRDQAEADRTDHLWPLDVNGAPTAASASREVAVKALEWRSYPGDGTSMQEGQGERRIYLERALHPYGAFFLMLKDGRFSVKDSTDAFRNEPDFGLATEARAYIAAQHEARIRASLATETPAVTPEKRRPLAEIESLLAFALSIEWETNVQSALDIVRTLTPASQGQSHAR